MAKELNFIELDNKLSKIDDRGSLIEKNVFSRVDEWIHSGNYLLNAQLSGTLFGGYPNSRSVALAGETGCLQENETIDVYIFKNKNIHNGRKVIEEAKLE